MIRCRKVPDKYRRSFDTEYDNVNDIQIDDDDFMLPKPMHTLKLNPWNRINRTRPSLGTLAHVRQIINPSLAKFSCYKVNTGLDAFTKRAVLKVSQSVVALLSYSGGKEAFWGSGVIFESFWKNDSLCYSVLTSATLLRPPPPHRSVFDLHVKGEVYDCLPIDEKIDVYLKGGKLCEGTIVTYDPHYNIAVLTFNSDIRLPCAVLRPLDDSVALNNAPTGVQGSASRFPYLPIKLAPRDVVIVVGRYTKKPFEIMAAPGRYSGNCFDQNTTLDCMDLLTVDCKITKCGIGGPLISCEGEVIGISFYAEHCTVCTPFLPINIFLKWWSHHKVTRFYQDPPLKVVVCGLEMLCLNAVIQ